MGNSETKEGAAGAQSVAAQSWLPKQIADYFVRQGWIVSYEPLTYVQPSGTSVRADLYMQKPTGEKFFVECKVGDPNSFLPISTYAQAAQLAQSGIPSVLYTNMRLSKPIGELFRTSKIPVVFGESHFDESIFRTKLREAIAPYPELWPKLGQ